MKISTRPRFEVRGKKRPRVWLLCSLCNKRIRRIAPQERVRVDRAHFCERHDPGWVVDNSALPLTDEDLSPEIDE